MSNRPQTRYASVGDADVVYQVTGDGPLDIVCMTGQWASIDTLWDYPPFVAELTRIASFGRLILLDRRGTGASDGLLNQAIPTWEEWTEDIRVVLDAVGSERAAIFAEGEQATIALMFAAMRPERVQALVLANTSPRMSIAPDYPIGLPPAAIETVVAQIASEWGTPELAAVASPIRAKEPDFADTVARMMRSSSTPREAAAQTRYILEHVDARATLPMVQAPTLILHNRNPLIPIPHGRYIADHIAGAKFVEMSGNDTQLFWNPGVVEEMIEFLTGERPALEIDRVLTTVVFTDIVSSTEQLASLGDRKWRTILDAHDRRVRDQFRQFRGREINTTGDGFVASFDGPACVVRCVGAITAAAIDLGISVRAGMHTGECEMRGDDLGGLAVHVAARVGALAGPGEVLVSRTVVDLVAGSGLHFLDRGDHQLKGVPGSWHLFVGAGMSARRVDANFGDCAAWLYQPDGDGPHPCVVMAHGFSLTRHHGLPIYAEAFARAGLATLVFDYRHLGDSGGDAGRIRVGEQRDDWRHAIADARSIDGIDPDRIILWGYSLGGGHAVEVASSDSRIAAVLALSPFLDGLSRVLGNPVGQTAWILPGAIADRLGRHVRIPATASPGQHGAMAWPGEYDGFLQSVPDGSSWRNEIGPGVFLTVAFFRPMRRAAKLTMPVWLGLGERDITVSPKAIRRVAACAPRAEVHTYPYDHFGGLWGDGPTRVVNDQIAFLRSVGLAPSD